MIIAGIIVRFSVYQSPMYESIQFDLIVERLIAIGYHAAITEYRYDPSFPVRSVQHSYCSCHNVDAVIFESLKLISCHSFICCNMLPFDPVLYGGGVNVAISNGLLISQVAS